VLRAVVVLTFALLLVPSSAGAQPDDADTLFEEGRTLAKAGDYAGACDRFMRSFAIDHAPGTELNMGDCQEHLGHARQAWQLYVAAAEEFDRKGEPARAKFARDRADAVASKLAEMIIQVADPDLPGLSIAIAGHDAKPAAEIHDRVEPGAVVVTALAPGHPPFTTTLQAVAGARVVVKIPAFSETHALPIASNRRRARIHLAYGFMAGGGASAAAALTFSLVGRSHWNSAADGPHCTHVSGGIMCDSVGTTQIHDAQYLADIGTGFFVGAGVLAATAAIIYFTAPTESTVVTPVATAQGVGLELTARF
jgi:hypothetical protein